MSFLLNSTFGIFSTGGGSGGSVPPFPDGAAINGVSVDPLSQLIVLGNDLDDTSATLLSDREIPMNGKSILFSLPGAAQDILRFDMVGSVAPFKFLMEHTNNDPGDGINNPMKWGWNIGRSDVPTASGIWFSMEPNYRPGGANWKETHLEIVLPDGTSSRLFSSTFMEGTTITDSQNIWYFSGTSFEFRNLDNTVATLALGLGQMALSGNIGGNTQFQIINGPDTAIFRMSPGTGQLELDNVPLRVNTNLGIQNQAQGADGRAGIRLFNHVGADADIIFHGPSWPDPVLAGGLQIANATTSNPNSILMNAANQMIFGNSSLFPIGTSPIQIFEIVNYTACLEFANNADAIAGGLVKGDQYRTGGVMMIVI